MSNPVTLAEVKRHLNIGNTNNDHDVYISFCLSVALAEAEKFTNRKFITETVTKYFDKWPSGDALALPYGNLQSVTSVSYKDTDGAWTVFSSGDYTVQIEEEPGKVVLEYGETWPTITLHPNKPIKVIYVCGYGATGDDVPAPIRAAIQVAAADLFEQRENFVIGVAHTQLKIFQSLLWPYKLVGGFI